MIEWTNNAPENPRGPALPIRRTPANKKLEAIVTSYDLIGCYTHFWHGSTHPCSGEDCEPCGEGMPFRWHAYLTCVDFHTNMHMIFECTGLSAAFFTAHRDKFASLRGCHFIATRWNSKPNGRIQIRTKMANLAERAIPEPPDLKAAMAILWSVKSGEVTTPYFSPENRMKIVAAGKPNGTPK